MREKVTQNVLRTPALPRPTEHQYFAFAAERTRRSAITHGTTDHPLVDHNICCRYDRQLLKQRRSAAARAAQSRGPGAGLLALEHHRTKNRCGEDCSC